MRIAEFRAILKEFAREVRQGRIITEAVDERSTLAALAEQLDARIGNANRVYKIESTEISFSPSKCPCCGK
jgi:hypothetical protein